MCDEDVKIVIYVLAESVAARLRENGFRCRVAEANPKCGSQGSRFGNRQLLGAD